MSINYEYNESSAVQADKAASRITEGGAYVGQFKKVFAIESEKGSKGLDFTFDAPGNGIVNFRLYTHGQEGQEIMGMNYVNAMLFMLGVKSLKSEAGTAEIWDANEGKRIEQEIEEFPALYGKSIGLMFQRELSSYNGKTQDRLNLECVFQPETKLLVSEIKERKTQPVKYDRMLKMCSKVKDARKLEAAEPPQPNIGASAGDY